MKDKVCIIVGAASLRGIGYATAELFAEHGAKLAVADIMMTDRIAADVKASIARKTKCETDLLGLACDISSLESCKKLVDAVVARYGSIDCLVNSAAIVQTKEMLAIEETDYDRMMSVNLKGAFNLCKSVLKTFAGQKRGTIVNVASVAAQRGGGLVGGAHYAASKGGVISLTRSIAREFGHLGIRANVVCPAMIETDMLNEVSAERHKEIVGTIPLQRAGRAIEVAGACLYLASDLSTFVTGATIDVNGGSHIH